MSSVCHQIIDLACLIFILPSILDRGLENNACPQSCLFKIVAAEWQQMQASSAAVL